LEVSTTDTGRRWLAVSFGSFADLAGEVQFGPWPLASDAPSLIARAGQGWGKGSLAGLYAP
jgi:hypothetical protein